jgi:feruloyl esterase
VKRRLGPIMDATNADLTAFKARGGKLILFHGWNDPALPAGMTLVAPASFNRLATTGSSLV